MDRKTYKCQKCGADVEIKNIENRVCDFCGAKINLSETDFKKVQKEE